MHLATPSLHYITGQKGLLQCWQHCRVVSIVHRMVILSPPMTGVEPRSSRLQPQLLHCVKRLKYDFLKITFWIIQHFNSFRCKSVLLLYIPRRRHKKDSWHSIYHFWTRSRGPDIFANNLTIRSKELWRIRNLWQWCHRWFCTLGCYWFLLVKHSLSIL